MKSYKIIFWALFLTSTMLLSSCSKESTCHFYTAEQLENIHDSYKTERGKSVVAGLQKRVDERAKFGFDIPEKTTIRLQNYLCPVHKIVLRYEVDKPHEHYCDKCGTYITNNDYLDACWRNYYQREMGGFIENCGQLYLITHNEKYLNYLKEIFLKYAQVYPKYPDYSDEVIKKKYYLGKMLEQFMEEAHWFTQAAPIYDAISDKFTPEERTLIEENLFRKAANMILKRKGQHNWRTFNNMMRASIAVVLKDKDLMNKAIYDTGGFNDDLKNMVFEDGWSKEGPGYHNGIMTGLQNIAISANAFGIDLFSGKLLSMFKNVYKMAYADHTLPSYSDGGYRHRPEKNAGTYELCYAYTQDPEIKAILSRFYARTSRNSFASLLNKEEILPDNTPLKEKSHIFKGLGVAVLRHGPITATLKYGYNEGGHGHPDRLAITLHDGTKELLTDCGTFSYAQPVYKNWHKCGLSHNMVLVDGKDMKISKPFSMTGGELVSYEFQDTVSSVVASLEKDTVCPGVKLVRSISLNAHKFSDSFTASSAKQHSYDYIFALSDKPELDSDFKLTKDFKGESPAYSFIKDVTAKVYKSGKISFKAGKYQYSIQNKLNKPITVFYAKAPDIVYGRLGGKEHHLDAYMLVVRTYDKNMNIESSINF